MAAVVMPAASRGIFARLNGFFPFHRLKRGRKGLAQGVDMVSYSQTFMHSPGKPVWMNRDYTRFSTEAYVRNVIAHRCIHLIAQSAAMVPWKLFSIHRGGVKKTVASHAVLDLLNAPNPLQSGNELFEEAYAYRLISGNAYILAIGPQDEAPRELHTLRPDRVGVIAGKSHMPEGYRYTVGERYTDYPVNRLNGQSRVLHLKTFHPLNDWYGLSPIEAAAFSIDLHNNSSAWNQSLLQNGARPSGALVVKTPEGASLSENQYSRIKQQMDEQFSGSSNAGRPLLLEGGLDWKEMSLSPKDMDFLEAKHSAARDIALAFGVPPQLLGIPGDNTYSNFAEARLALWEQTILPLLDIISKDLSMWLLPMFGNNLLLSYDTDSISALAPRREVVWKRIKNADFLTEDEKRTLLGLSPKPPGA